jgi:SAM-dependent methyltransferase
MHLDADLFKSRLFIIKKLQRNTMRAQASRLKGRVLDIGCGTRPYRKFIECSSYIGIDEVCSAGIEAQASALRMPFADGSFDGAILSEVLEHVPEPQVAVNELYRVLKSGGIAYVSAPMSWALHYQPHDYWRFTHYGLAHLLKACGFKILATERIGGIFSLIGQRSIDVLWAGIVSILSFLGRRWAERIATGICLPLSLAGYGMAKIGDGIDKTDALGWVVVAQK